MRARNIKPGFYKNEKLAACSRDARLLAPGLWMLADKEGRLEDRPIRIKMEIFPADNIEVEPLLQELHTHQHILRYGINGVKYIQILGFKDHQSPHYSEKDSIIPSPIQDHSEKNLSSSKEIPPPQPPDLLNPDSLTVLTNVRNARQVKKQIPYPENFLQFWKAYPRKDGSKSTAFESYEKSLTSGVTHETLIGSAQAFAAFHRAKGTATEHIPHATTWLNEQRWEGDYTITAAPVIYQKPKEIRAGATNL